jgi:hypothetical protein
VEEFAAVLAGNGVQIDFQLAIGSFEINSYGTVFGVCSVLA